MKKISGRIIFVILCLFLMALSVYLLYVRESITVIEGVADLSTFDFQEKGEVAISGNWEFYWDQLLTPDDFITDQSKGKIFLKVPGPWSTDEREVVPNQGVATAYKVYADG